MKVIRFRSDELNRVLLHPDSTDFEVDVFGCASNPLVNKRIHFFSYTVDLILFCITQYGPTPPIVSIHV